MPSQTVNINVFMLEIWKFFWCDLVNGLCPTASHVRITCTKEISFYLLFPLLTDVTCSPAVNSLLCSKSFTAQVAYES